MTIYSDTIDNKFMGDCIYANHRTDYLSVNHLKAYPYSDVSAELTQLCTQAGLRFRNVLTQSEWDIGATVAFGRSLIAFGANSDGVMDDRYCFNCHNFFQGAVGNTAGHISMYNDSGYTLTNNVSSSTNLILGLFTSGGVGLVSSGATNSTSAYGFQSPQNTELNTPIYVAGVCDGESLALFFYQTQLNTNVFNTRFLYAGQLVDVNTNSNYYSANKVSSSFCLTIGNTTPFGVNLLSGGAHRIAGVAKQSLQTGDAQYPIVCNDGQTPTATWATDFYVFDDNPALDYPGMGKVRNLLLATGTFTIGKPVRIEGSVFPDAGFNAWLPVGTYAGKTILMRCYSSVAL